MRIICYYKNNGEKIDILILKIIKINIASIYYLDMKMKKIKLTLLINLFNQVLHYKMVKLILIIDFN